MEKITSFVKAHKILTVLAVVVLVGGGYFWYVKAHPKTAKAQYIESAAGKTTITVSVSASGQVSAENQIDLKPGSSGSLTSVNVKSGDQVKAGQVIGVVDQSSNNVALVQAKASVMKAEADYNKLLAGLTGTDLALAQQTVTSAQTAVDKAKRDYDQTVTDQQAAVAKAYNKMLNSGLEVVANDSLSTATISLSGTYTGTSDGAYTISFYNSSAAGLYYSVSGLGGEHGPVTRGLNLPLGNGLYMNIGSSGTLTQDGASYTIAVPNKTSSEYYTNQTAYNDAVTNQTKAVQSAQDGISSAQQNLQNAQLEFQQKTEAADNASLAEAKAAVLSAQASLQQASNNYNNNVLKSPFDGVVAVLNSKKGDQVTSATVVATIITKQQLAVVSLNEVDAAKVKVGQKANLSFDAIDGLSLTGEVVEISSIGATSQGVVSYPVKIAFDAQDPRIKPSMSVSADVITDVKTDVLSVPSSAVKTNGNGTYVQTLDANGQPQNVSVEVGISNDTETEIVSGITDGQKVVSQTITPTVAGASTSRTNNATGIPGLSGNTRGAAANRSSGQFFIQQGR